MSSIRLFWYAACASWLCFSYLSRDVPCCSDDVRWLSISTSFYQRIWRNLNYILQSSNIKFSFFNNNHLSLREHFQFWKALLIVESQHWKEHMVRRMSKHDQDLQKFRNTGGKNYQPNLKLKSCYSFFRNFV